MTERKLSSANRPSPLSPHPQLYAADHCSTFEPLPQCVSQDQQKKVNVASRQTSRITLMFRFFKTCSMTGEPFSPDHSPNPSWTSGDRAEPRGGGPEKLAAVQLLLPLKHLSTATTTPTPTHTDNVRDTPRDICLGLRSQSHRQHPIEMFESVP